MWDENGKLYRMCVVGNIIGNHYRGTAKEVRSGTKHFREGAKVYCIFIYGGMGHLHVRVLGKPRNCGRMIDVVMLTSFIKNFRLKRVYETKVIAFMDKYLRVNNTEFIAENMFEELNKGHREIVL